MTTTYITILWITLTGWAQWHFQFPTVEACFALLPEIEATLEAETGKDEHLTCGWVELSPEEDKA
jgi:hypothetical protein